MNEQNNGWHAFPMAAMSNTLISQNKGMSLRDYFAAKALSAFAHGTEAFIKQDCRKAYEYADAMLKVREQ